MSPADLLHRFEATRDADLLRAASAGELAAALRAELDEAEASHPVLDEDRWLALGQALRVAGRADADAVVAGWLSARPSAARLEPAAAVLGGRWTGGEPGAEQVAAARALARAAAGVDDASALFVAVRALERAARPDLPHDLAADLARLFADAPARAPAGPWHDALVRAARSGRERLDVRTTPGGG